MFNRRTVLLGAMLVSAMGVASADPSGGKQFLGKWSGWWDGKWPMSIEVLSIKGNKAAAIYTWPDGSSQESGTIVGNTLKVGQYITLNSPGPNEAVADGDFPTAHRTAKVNR